MSKPKVTINPTNVKRILFNVKYEGQGVVNYDHASLQRDKMKQVKGWRKSLSYKNSKGEYSDKENISLAKKSFFEIGKDKDGNSILDYKLKVSRNAIMHSMYREVDMAISASIMNNETEQLLRITCPETLVRGYMFAPKSDGKNNKNLTIKKKGAVTMVDAIQSDSCTAKSSLEIGTNHKEKEQKTTVENGDEKGDTSMFERENVGKIKYEANGNFINLAQLEFVPAMPETDRVSFNPDLVDKWLRAFDLNMLGYSINSTNDVTKGGFKLKSSKSDLKENGLLLSPKVVNMLVKDFFTRLMKLRINRGGSTLNVSEIEVCFESDNLEVDGNNSKKFITLTPEVLGNLNFSYESAYEQLADDFPSKAPLDVETEDVEKAEKPKAKTRKKATA